jgi:hypothetical protein
MGACWLPLGLRRWHGLLCTCPTHCYCLRRKSRVEPGSARYYPGYPYTVANAGVLGSVCPPWMASRCPVCSNVHPYSLRTIITHHACVDSGGCRGASLTVSLLF